LKTDKSAQLKKSAETESTTKGTGAQKVERRTKARSANGRVDDIRQAINEGRFNVSSEQVANRLLTTVKDVLKKPKKGN
jgi:anti-sigma28 factor (negative regulator of flagellin synthesis)